MKEEKTNGLSREVLESKKSLLQMSPNDLDLLDNAELLVTLNISQRTALRWRAEGTIPFVRIKRKIYYRKGDIDKLINSNYLKNPKY